MHSQIRYRITCTSMGPRSYSNPAKGRVVLAFQGKFAKLSIGIRHAQQSTCGGRQNVSETGINHAEMRVLRIPRRHIPWSASQIGILDIILETSVPPLRPDTMYPSQTRLLLC